MPLDLRVIETVDGATPISSRDRLQVTLLTCRSLPRPPQKARRRL